jgi:hypothetical protein
MKKSFIKIWALCGVFFGASVPASAAVLNFIGDFDATFYNPTQGIPNITVNWSLDFDTDRIPSIGTETLAVDLTSLTISPNHIGTTTFSVSNSSGWLQYQNGVLIGLGIGGDINGPGISSDTDDFDIGYYPTGEAWSAAVSVASVPLSLDVAPSVAGTETGTVSGSFSIVPIPPTAWLFSFGMLGLTAMAKRKKAA